MVIRTCLGVAVAVCLLAAVAVGEPITLASAGRPAATIVIPKDSDPKLAAAAAELQTYVKRICGVELPLRRDGKQVEGTGLYIGRCDLTSEGDLPGKDLSPEAYAIRLRQQSVLLVGRWPTPTCFAVSSFIEDNLNVRWFAPGELWEHIPRGKKGELTVEVKEVVKVPHVSPRIWSGHGWFESWNAWNLRNKTVLGEVVPRRQFQNNLYRVFPPDKYAKDHPEFYPLIDGKRWIPPGGSHWRPCESNPEVLRLTVQYARRWFDEHPQLDSFSLGMDDISHLCGCANCRALDPHPDSYEKREFSDRHYKFVNAVAAEVRKTHPDRYIGTLIYNIAREIPQTVPRLEDNVFGFITETSALWWQEGRKEADHKITRDWAKRCKHLSRYDYYGMGTFTPRVYPHAMAEQLKFDKSLGLEGMYTEVYTFLPHTAPMIWAFAKLQWDCTLDVDELLGEFCSKMYGQAGPIMKQYFDLLERSWNTPRPGRAGWVHRNLVAQSLAVSPEDVDAGFGLLAKATSAAEGPDLRQRIEIHRAALEYASYVIYAQGISCKLISTAVTDEKSALEALGLVEKLGSLAEGRKKCWAEAPKRDDLLGETLRGLGWKMKYLAIGQVSNVERGGLIGVMKVLGWQSRYPERRISKVEDRLGQLSAGSVGQIVKAWRWMQRTKPKSLLGNGGFEGDAAAGKKPKEDWIVRGAPQGWSSWSRTPAVRYAVLGRKGQDGSAAASIAGADSACYMQTVAARPGQKYLCTCWLRAERPGLDCGGRLSVRFRDGRGGWHARGDLEPSLTMVEGQRDWQPLTLLVEVPDGAASFVVMLGAGNQAKGTSVLFDNAAVYLLP